MMSNQLSPKEWQTLSAYLDGQLSERETRQVEARLRTQPDLQSGLEELRHTRMLLRSLPKRRAPRNFTLTREMAEQIRPARQKAQPRFFSTLRLVSAFASFLLVMTFLGDLALQGTTNNLVANQAREMQPAMEAAAPQAPPTEQVFEPFMAAPEEALQTNRAAQEEPTPGAELRVFGSEIEPTPDETEIARRMTAAPPGMGGAVSEPEGTPGVGGGGPDVSTPLATPAPIEEPALATELPTEPAEFSMKAADTPVPTEQPLPEQPQADGQQLEFATQPQDLAADQAEAAEAQFDARSLFRPVEITLAVIALICGLAAVYLRLKTSP